MNGDQPADRDWVSVTASGEASTAPDVALVTLAVSAQGTDLAPLRDDVNRRTSSVLEALRGLGLDDADIDAPGISIQPQYDYRRGQRLVGYRVARRVTTRVRDLDQLGAVFDGVMHAGANEVGGAQMSASDPSVAEHAALQTAVKAARTKATVLAEAAGVSLGRVMRIEEEGGWDGPPQPVFRMAAAESADVPTEVSPGDLTIRRQIRAWFSID